MMWDLIKQESQEMQVKYTKEGIMKYSIRGNYSQIYIGEFPFVFVKCEVAIRSLWNAIKAPSPKSEDRGYINE